MLNFEQLPVCKEAHHDGGHNEKAAHQNPKYEEGGAGGMLNHLSIKCSIFFVLPECLQFECFTSLFASCLMSSPGITTVTPTLSWNPVACSISTDSLASSSSSKFSR